MINPTSKRYPTEKAGQILRKTKIKNGDHSPSSASSASSSSSASSTSFTSTLLNENDKNIEEIAKKISDHGETIYQHWKSKGLAPSEILNFSGPVEIFKESLTAAVPNKKDFDKLDMLVGESKQQNELMEKKLRQRSPSPTDKKKILTSGAIESALKKFENKNSNSNIVFLNTNSFVGGSSKLQLQRPSSYYHNNLNGDNEKTVIKTDKTLCKCNYNGVSGLCQCVSKSSLASSKSPSDKNEKSAVVIENKKKKNGRAPVVLEQNALLDKKIIVPADDQNQMDVAMPAILPSTPIKHHKSKLRSKDGGATEEKNIRPFLTRGSVAERVMMFEKCPDVRNPLLRNINRADAAKQTVKPESATTTSTEPSADAEIESHTTLQRQVRQATKNLYIPRFFFPHGKPQQTIATEKVLRGILSAFDSFPNNTVTKDTLPQVLKICGLPFYWRIPILLCTQTGNTGNVEGQRFLDFWKQMSVYCHDPASRFVYILSRGQRVRSFILPDDLAPLVQDVVDTHPGLAFLKEASEFHSRYVHTVIARIFYTANRSWSGKITVPELRKSNLLQVIKLLEDEEDINQIMAYFSYEHFYVIYCKFWELDRDHDLLIDQKDLEKHSDHALSTRIIERIFSGCVTRTDKQQILENNTKMSYTDFVWFLLSEEDKSTPTAIEYWFRCMDLDGDGILSMYELEYFYEEQQQRMESIGIETLPYEDCLCQMLDMIKPEQPGLVTLGDLKRCRLTPIFFDTFFNLEKYLDHEQRDPFSSQRGDGEFGSDWEKYAAQEYELLVAEDGDNH